jgi:hypothetical protein
VISGAESARFQNPKDVERPLFAEHLLTPRLPRFAPVTGFAIFDAATLENGLIGMSTKILTGVRDPIDNLTDPNVISIPTKRTSAARLQRLLRPYPLTDIEEIDSRPGLEKVLHRWGTRELDDPPGRKIIDESVRDIFTGKLGVGDALDIGSLQIMSAEPTASIFGKWYSSDEDPEIGAEMLHMAGMKVVVQFDKGNNPFPDKTDSYYSMQFLRVDDYINLVQNKDPFLIMQYGNFAEICVRGLCVLAGKEVIRGEQINESAQSF